jgi:hypothetical protein
MPSAGSTPPSQRPPEESGLVVLRFGTALGLAAVAALACSLPAAMRVSAALAGAEPTGRVWMALAAAALGPMMAAVLILRAARDGLRAFGGAGAELRVFGAALWVTSLVVALSRLGSTLRATTHNHALAGVTFAFGAVALAAMLAVFSARVVAILRDAGAARRYALGGAVGLIAFVGLASTVARFARAASNDPAPSAAAGAIIDVLAFALAALLASTRSLTARSRLALVGPPVAVVIAALGLSTLRDATLCDGIVERAPTFAPLVSALRVR